MNLGAGIRASLQDDWSQARIGKQEVGTKEDCEDGSSESKGSEVDLRVTWTKKQDEWDKAH